jgi:hypothetical protein
MDGRGGMIVHHSIVEDFIGRPGFEEKLLLRS